MKYLLHGVKIWQAFLDEKRPLEQVCAHYFSRTPTLGKQARQEITEALFSLCRQVQLFIYRLEEGGLMSAEIYRYLPLLQAGERADFSPFPEFVQRGVQRFYTLPQPSKIPVWAQANCPKAWWPFFKKSYGDKAGPLVKQMMETHPLAHGFCYGEQSPAALCKEVPELFSPLPGTRRGVVLKNSSGVGSLEKYGIILQDKGAQLLAEAFAPGPKEKVLDFCSGKGGKAIAAHGLREIGSEIHATEFDPLRFSYLKSRLKELELTETISTHSFEDILKQEAVYDKVLIDVPCSGSGTWGRHPDLPLRQGVEVLKGLMKTQQHILSQAWSLVKPGGLLLYGTCSLLEVENQGQIKTFLGKHPEAVFEDEDLMTPLACESQGFYLAKLRK